MLRRIYLTKLFFYLFAVAVVLFATAFVWPNLEFVAVLLMSILLGITLLDTLLVFSTRQPLLCNRILSKRMNLGDPNLVRLKVRNQSTQVLSFTLYEGFPTALQERSTSFKAILKPKSSKEFNYQYKPTERGEHTFGDVFILLSSIFRLVSRRIDINASETVHVYPSVLQLKKYELLVFQQKKISSGIKKVRRLGNNSEFEQIKAYVQGDEVKTINWKATSRRNELMVNQYQEEKAQHFYCIIDKSRAMQMEFDQLTMLDWAINSTLVLSNVTLRNGDKTGLLTFSNKIGTQIAAERTPGQLQRIMEALYNQKTRFLEANYELLFNHIRRTIKTRSLLLLFSNFETEFSMRRALPVLRRLNKKHVLVVVFFENDDLQELVYRPSKSVREVYRSVVAEGMISQKRKIAEELQINGIQTLLTHPEYLSIQAINKYLEIKAKGMV